MSEELEALGRRAVACKGWRWMPGMLTNHGARYLGKDGWIDRAGRGVVYADPNDGEVPDLSDAATLGCLLALVREAWAGDEWISVTYARQERRWVVVSCHGSALLNGGRYIYGATEAEALVAALEAAP